jgi:predicted GH43/DUF377 family glycosyl hydrolase
MKKLIYSVIEALSQCRPRPFVLLTAITLLVLIAVFPSFTLSQETKAKGKSYTGGQKMSNEIKSNSQPGLVMGPGPEGWWDSERVSSPQVLLEADGTWKMWYYGRDATFDRMINLPSGRCGMAISKDGVTWERVRGPLTMGSVLEPVPASEDSFDNAHVGVTDIHYDNGLYWMWYFGGDQTVIDIPMPQGVVKAKGVTMLPGCAISRDGLNWTKLKGPYRGAFLDHGGKDDWDAAFCSWPRVLKEDDGSYKMYYHTLNPAKFTFQIGMAVSDDGFRWKKVGKILPPGKPGSFDEKGVSCRHVLKIDGQYVMFYEGMDAEAYYCIGIAISDDGINWRKDDAGEQPGGPVFCHAPKGSGRWDARAVGTPFVVPMPDGSYRMYYIGANEGGYDELSTQHQIGMAVSDGPNFRKWRRWGE